MSLGSEPWSTREVVQTWLEPDSDVSVIWQRAQDSGIRADITTRPVLASTPGPQLLDHTQNTSNMERSKSQCSSPLENQEATVLISPLLGKGATS